MKIAICLSGHLRKYEQAFPSLHLYLLQTYDCDIFLSTWDRMGYVSQYKSDSRQDLTNQYVKDIERIIKPKKMVIENSAFIEELKHQGNEYAPHLRNEPKHVGHMASMFYKIYAANELRKSYELETGIEYDWVIRCRPDLLFHGNTTIPTDKVAKQIYIPSQHFHHKWFGDQFAISLPNEMDLYSSLFFHMPEYFKARNEFYPERFMNWGLQKLGLIPTKWDCHFDILR
jgi:hypothetical protein